MRYTLKFQDEDVSVELSDEQFKAVVKKASKKELIVINGEAKNTAYLKSINKNPSSADLLTIEQKETLKELQTKYKSDQKQIEEVNQEGLERLRKLKTKLL